MSILNKLVIHEIIKNENETNASSCILSENLLEIDSRKTETIVDLNKKYSAFSQTMAVFDEEETDMKKVPRHFRDYMNGSLAEYDFLRFSRDCTENLVKHITSENKAKGGYLVFAEYEDINHYIGVFFVRNKRGNIFSMDATNTYQINDSTYIDIENMAMAARINLHAYSINNRFVSFINKSNVDSKYFLRWFCANDTRNNIDDTKMVYRMLSDIDLPDTSIDRQDFINEIYEYIRPSNKGEVLIDLRAIGSEFFGNESALINYADTNNLIINHEFTANRGVLKSFVNLKAKADKITLNFPLDYFGNKVRIVDNQIIIESESLIRKIQAEQQGNV